MRFAPLLAAFAVVGLALASVGAPSKPTAARVTYAGQVAQILNQRCVTCHHDGGVAPMSLVGFTNAKKWSLQIANVTKSRWMPPWKAEHGYGSFRDENRLSDAELRTLEQWCNAGPIRGDSRHEPKPPSFTSSWGLGKPDLVIAPSKPFHLEAEGSDVYRNFVVYTNGNEPMYVKAMDVRPGNHKIVHHVIMYVDDYGAAVRLQNANKDGQDGFTSSSGGIGFLPSGSLGGWAPGLTPRMAPEGTAFKVNPGAKLVLQIHYHRSGKEEQDQTQVALYFAKEPVTNIVNLAWIMNFTLNIPAGDASYHIQRRFRVPEDVTLHTVMPHMHLLGRQMEAHVELPNGTKKPLIRINDWDFNWQLVYSLQEPMHIPKGSTIVVNGTYDNSANNPRNPNSPPKRVTWGEQTTDEMFLLIAAYTKD